MNPRLDPRRWLRYLLAPLDGPLTLLLLILVGYATVVMVSASPERLGMLALNTGVAFVVMWVAARTPPSRMMSAALPLYVVGVLLLIAVALFGDVSKGARRWLNIGVTRIQPSELLKIAVPLTLAWYFQSREGMLRAKDFFIAAGLLLLPVGLIAKQPDLGTAILVAAAGFYVLFFAGLAWRLILPVALVGIVGIGARRGAAIVRAGFQGHVGGGAARRIACFAQGVDLGVRLAGACVPAFADGATVAHQHATDARVRRGGRQSAGGKLQRARHRRMISCRKGHARGPPRASRSCSAAGGFAPRGSTRRTHPRRRSCDTPTRSGCRPPCRAS